MSVLDKIKDFYEVWEEFKDEVRSLDDKHRPRSILTPGTLATNQEIVDLITLSGFMEWVEMRELREEEDIRTMLEEKAGMNKIGQDVKVKVKVEYERN